MNLRIALVLFFKCLGLATFISGYQLHGLNVKSYNSIKNDSVVRQYRDYSCGLASLQTIVLLKTGLYTDESCLINRLLEDRELKNIPKHRGLSLSEISEILSYYGIQSGGISTDKINLKKILNKGLLTVLLLKSADLNHFVVVYDYDYRYFYVKDPSLGNRRIENRILSQIWDGKCLVTYY
jgi:uncharacterized protein